MQQLLIRLFVNAVALAAAVWLVGGISIASSTTNRYLLTLVGVSAIFGLINAILKPVVQLLALPLLIVTLGLLAFVINGLMLWLTSGISGLVGIPFHVAGFWPAVWGALVVSIVGLILNLIFPDEEEEERRRQRQGR